MNFTESVVEEAALAWLESLGYAILNGPEIAAGEPSAERSAPNHRDVVLEGRLQPSLVPPNPVLPPETLEETFRRLAWADAPSLVERNRGAPRDALLPKLISGELRIRDAERIIGSNL